jgi:23S rRNA (uracil1939-C5)-methyltransferase
MADTQADDRTNNDNFSRDGSPSLSERGTWQQGESLEIEIVDLSDRGDGVGRWHDRVVFVPQTAIGDRVEVRLVRVKRSFAHAKLLNIVKPSPDRQRPPCILADKCGGCQWQHVVYATGENEAAGEQGGQLGAKYQQVVQALQRIGGFETPPVDAVKTTGQDLHYRNKVTYPVDRGQDGRVRAGYYQQGSHKIVNLNQCPVQPEAFDEILQQVKRDIEDCDWPIYDEKQHTGEIRHIGLRIGYHTGEMLLTLVTRGGKLPDLEAQAQHWLKGFPNLVGVTININPQKTNAIFGAETYTVAGSGVLNEKFAGLNLELGSDTFFQVNTEAAEIMIETLIEGLKLQPEESLLDAYCGIGTFTLPLAKAVKQAIGIEVHERSVDRAEANAIANGIENAFFYAGRVEDRLFQVASDRLFGEVDAVILDPPRQGCDPIVIDALRRLKPKRIGYASCKPATLARDLKMLCEGGLYTLDRVQPVDLFPHTSHVESIAFLTLDPEMAAVRTITKVE